MGTPNNHYDLYVTPIGYICECGDVVKLPYRTRYGEQADASDINRQAELHKVHYHEFCRDTVTIHHFTKENQ